MCCSFRGRRSTLDVSIVIWRGRRSTLDVSCCVFFAHRIVRAASGGDKVQIPWYRRGILWDVMKIDGSLARNIDSEVANLEAPKKTPIGKRWFWFEAIHSIKIRRSLPRKVRFAAPTRLVSSLWFPCGLAVSMGEAAKHLLFEGFQLWNLEAVSHEMLVFLRSRVSSRVSGFSCGLAVSMGEAAKPLLFEGCHAGCHVVLRGRRSTLWHSNLF